MAEPQKRQWCYVLPPVAYDIAAHECGHNDPMWSEYVDQLWCPTCQVDFTPSHWGIFSGPIPLQISEMLGIVFHRYELATGRVVKFGDKEWDATRP